MPCPIDFNKFSMGYINELTALPWHPMYSQSSGSGGEPSVLYTYAMALTILFTVFVFSFEHALNERQAAAYQITEFPKQLEETVSKIDAEREATENNEKVDDKQKGSADEKNDGDVKDDDGEKKINKDEPLLPQLKEKFTETQSYGTAKVNFVMVCSVYNLAEHCIFLLGGFHPFVWDMSVKAGEKHFGWNETDNEIKISLIFLLVTTIVGTITSLPFELYKTFWMEKKHGFNKQTPGLFVADKVKMFIINCAIGGPFTAALLKIIKWGGEQFYVYVWAFMFVFSVSMMTIYPEFIMPAFNKFEPLPEGELKTRIYALADTLKYPLTKLFVVDGSKRSSHSNAYMFGFGKNKRIVLFDTLMGQVSNDEILAILGHELGHWKLGHTLINFVIVQSYTAIAFYCFSLCYGSIPLYRAFGFDGVDRPIPTLIALLLFFNVCWQPVDQILSFFLNINSRRNEFQADQFSADLGFNQKLQSGLLKISLENLGALCPDWLYAIYHYSHPPLVERLHALRKLEKKSN